MNPLPPAIPLKNPNVQTYTGLGSGVLAPGVVVGPNGYQNPKSIIATIPGVYPGPVQQIAPSPTPVDPAAAAAAKAKSDTLGYLNDQSTQLRDLLSRTDTNLNQGLQTNDQNYQQQVGNTNQSHDQQVVGQNKQKMSAIDTITQNAGNAYHSLAQLIGRSAGTGSSAFRELLPNVVGKDTSSKTQSTNDTFGQNLSNIDASTQNALADLIKQKKTNEDSVRTNVEQQRQDLNNKLAQNAAAVVQANGGDYASVQAAQQPFQDAINKSRDAVQGFFNTFNTPYTPQAVDPNLAQYQTDRSVINAQQDGAADPNNPYASLLRKKLQGVA